MPAAAVAHPSASPLAAALTVDSRGTTVRAVWRVDDVSRFDQDADGALSDRERAGLLQLATTRTARALTLTANAAPLALSLVAAELRGSDVTVTLRADHRVADDTLTVAIDTGDPRHQTRLTITATEDVSIALCPATATLSRGQTLTLRARAHSPLARTKAHLARGRFLLSYLLEQVSQSSVSSER